jgi:ubiquinone/menaquinone biosynthesis C-methylase UbiE
LLRLNEFYLGNEMKRNLQEIIRQANVDVHAAEAMIYDALHTEIFNRYEQNRVSAGIRKIVSLVNGEKGATALDVGCGTGNVALKLAAEGFQVTAIDISPEMLSRLSERVSTAGLKDQVQIVCCDAEDFLRNSQTWDVIAFSSVLHHLPDYYRVLQLAASTLEGGVIYIVHEPLSFRRVSLLSQALRKPFRELFLFKLRLRGIRRPYIDYSYSDYHARDGINVEKLSSFLEEQGFVIVEIQRYAVENFALWARVRTTLLKEYDSFGLIAWKTER